MLIFLVLIRPGPLQVFATIDNPFGFGPDIRALLGPIDDVAASRYSSSRSSPCRSCRAIGCRTGSVASN